MGITIDWKIRARNPQCDHSGAEFQDEEEFRTCIFEDPESDGFLRRDYSLPAWREIKDELNPSPFSYWKSVFKVPPVIEEEEPIDNSAEGMLRRMIEEEDPKTENARYILALMLERKKTLIPTDVKETENSRLLFYEHKDSGEVLIIADPGLKLDELEAVQAEVSAQLDEEQNRLSPGKVESPESTGDEDENQSEEDSEEAAETEDEAVAASGE